MKKIDAMLKAGKINQQAIQFGFDIAVPGMSKLELDQKIGEFIFQSGGEPAFLEYMGFPGNCCICIDEEIVHGLPTDRKIEDGCILTIDCGVRVDGWNVDAAITKIIGIPRNKEDLILVETTKKALSNALEVINNETYINSISDIIYTTAINKNLSVYPDFAGHGIGRNIHEEPSIYNVPQKTNEKLIVGQTVAIEPLFTIQDTKWSLAKDGWTCISNNNSAHFEHTIIVTENGYKIIS